MLKKLTNKKGFTLMEMLIVVAIIAILIAIAIPTFNSALNKAKVGTDTANIRSGYAAAKVEALTGKITGTEVYKLAEDGSVATAPAKPYKTMGKPDAGFTIGEADVSTWDAGKVVTYTVDATGKITIGFADS